MASLSTVEKRHLEELFEMSGGYVLRFSSKSRFAEAVRDSTGIDIGDQKYAAIGTSMANRLRAFWSREVDQVVGRLINSFVNFAESFNSAEPRNVEICRHIVSRLTGGTQTVESITTNQFLSHEYPEVKFDQLPIESGFVPVMQYRWVEVKKCMDVGANLSVILLLGSLLEGILLGAAQSNPKIFNQCPAAPKDESNKVLPHWKWKLSELIDTAHGIGMLKLDVKKFSHALRDFRNYIHPYEQKASGFSPDQDTARICLQVFRAAVNQLSKRQ
jgi:hypothetical protein